MCFWGAFKSQCKHYIIARETTRYFKMLSSRVSLRSVWWALQFMRGVRFLGGSNFQKEKINSKMCSSLAIVLCLRHNKSRLLRTPYWSTIFTPVELTTNAVFLLKTHQYSEKFFYCCNVMLPSAAYRISNLSLLIPYTTFGTELFRRSQVAIRDFKRTTTARRRKGGEMKFSMN